MGRTRLAIRSRTSWGWTLPDLPLSWRKPELNVWMQIDHVRMPWLDHVQFNQSFAEPKFGSSSLAAEVVELTTDTAQLDMRFVATERTGGLRLDCEFRTELFDRESVKPLLEGFAGVLEAVAHNPERRVADFAVPRRMLEQAKAARRRPKPESPKARLIFA